MRLWSHDFVVNKFKSLSHIITNMWQFETKGDLRQLACFIRSCANASGY